MEKDMKTVPSRAVMHGISEEEKAKLFEAYKAFLESLPAETQESAPVDSVDGAYWDRDRFGDPSENESCKNRIQKYDATINLHGSVTIWASDMFEARDIARDMTQEKLAQHAVFSRRTVREIYERE